MCPMDLKYFPMDNQICRLVMESYGYELEDIDYFWIDDGYGEQLKEISLPNFEIKKYRLIKENKYYSSGGYSNLIFEMLLIRSMGFYLNQVYIPACLIVIISWIPFWLDRDDTHARVGLGVTTVLTMTTLVTETNQSMPKISYMKALDIYLEFCFAMVFASLIQYAIVGYFTVKVIERRSDWMEMNDKNIKHGELAQCEFKDNNVITRQNPSRIDSISRWAFPVTFIVFNLLYWSIYLILSKPKFN